MTTRAEYHNATARHFIAEARDYLAADDLLQASEKGWGAAAQAVKSGAETRGWPHNGHRQLFQAVDRLVAETGDEDIRTAFTYAGALHTNFYEGWLGREAVEAHISQVAVLVEKLETRSL